MLIRMQEKIASEKRRDAAAVLALLVVLTVLFTLIPWSGDDWETFYGASQRVLNGDKLYGPLITHAYYSNPPWLALILTPLTLLPEKIGWALLCAATLMTSMLLLHAWTDAHPGLVKPLLVLTSPAMFYILLHGQIDVLIIAGVLLPEEWWPFVALTKPQVAIGLLFGTPPRRWLVAGMIVAAAVGITILLFGFWPSELMRQPTPFKNATHNLWLGLWPFQVPAGVVLILKGIQHRDGRLLVAGSPFLSPYAATSSLIGPWIAVVTYLTDWQGVIVWASWWGAVVYRGVA
jgi:hypothetical protein